MYANSLKYFFRKFIIWKRKGDINKMINHYVLTINVWTSE